MFNKISSMGFLAIALAALVLLIWYLSTREKYKGKEPGVILVDVITEYNLSIFMILIILFNMGQSFLAASLDAGGTNPLARALSHFAMAFMGITFCFAFIPGVQNFLKWKGRPWHVNVVWCFVLLLLIVGMLAPPAMNTYAIAHTINQVPHLTLFFEKMAFWVPADQYYIDLQRSGVLKSGQTPLSYNAFQGLETVLVVDLFLVVLHILAMGYEGGMKYLRMYEETAAAEKKDEKKDDKKDGKKADAKDDKKKTDAKKDGVDGWKETIGVIADCMGVDPNASVFNLGRAAITKLDGEAQTEAFEIVEKCYTKALDAKAATGADKDKLSKEVDEEMRAFFRKSQKNGGLGLDIPKGKVKK